MGGARSGWCEWPLGHKHFGCWIRLGVGLVRFAIVNRKDCHWSVTTHV